MSTNEGKFVSALARIRISGRVLILYAPISILAVPLSFSRVMTSETFLDSLAIGFLATIFTIVIMIGLQYLIVDSGLVRSAYRGFLTVALILVLVGLLRGLSIYFGINFFEIQQPTNLLSKLLSSISSTVFWILAIASFENALVNFRNDFKDLWRQAIILASIQNSPHQSGYISREILTEYNALIGSLKKIITVHDHQILDKNFFVSLSSQLREVISISLRPLSHRIWLGKNALIPKIKISQYLLFTSKNVPATFITSGVALALISLFNIGSQFGLIRSLNTVVIVLMVFGFFWKINQSGLNRFFRSRTGRVGSVFLPGFLISLGQYFSNRFIYNDDLGAWNAFYATLTPLIQIIVSSAVAIRSDLIELENQIRNGLEKVLSQGGRDTRIFDGEFASYLHNSVQSEIMALSYQLERFDQGENSEEKKRLLERLSSRLNKGVEADFDEFFDSAPDRIAKLERAWRGIAEVTIVVPEEILKRVGIGFLVVQIVEESILNAVRFCKAKEISVYVEGVHDQSFTLVVANDGVPPRDTGVGLGTQWLDANFPDKWKREESLKGSILKINF